MSHWDSIKFTCAVGWRSLVRFLSQCFSMFFSYLCDLCSGILLRFTFVDIRWHETFFLSEYFGFHLSQCLEWNSLANSACDRLLAQCQNIVTAKNLLNDKWLCFFLDFSETSAHFWEHRSDSRYDYFLLIEQSFWRQSSVIVMVNDYENHVVDCIIAVESLRLTASLKLQFKTTSSRLKTFTD